MIKFIPLTRMFPTIKDEYYAYLDDIYTNLDRHFEGEHCLLAEDKLKQLTGVNHALVTTSGTTAIILMLLAKRIGPGDEVICINYSCPASAMPVKVVGAQPVLVDINKHGQMNVDDIKKAITPKTKAILATSLYGDSFDYDAIKDLGIPILNDSAQTIFNKYKGIENTNLGEMSIVSFSTNKNIPIFGTYGAVLTNDQTLNDDLYVIRRNGYLGRDVGNAIYYTGMNAQPHPDKCAQLLCSLNKATEWQQRRKEIADYYHSVLPDLGVQVRPNTEYSESNNHKYAIFVNNKFAFRDKMLEHGVEMQLHYTYNFSQTPVFKSGSIKEDYKWSNFYVNHAISLPASPWHTDSEVEQVVSVLKKHATKEDLDVRIQV